MDQSRSWQSSTVMVVFCIILMAELRPLRASDFPYWGVVTLDRVNVHSGAGDSYYAAGHLAKGALVQVHNHFHLWFKISPPEGVYSYVKKAFINRQGRLGDGAVGTATRDGVMVRTAAVGDGLPGASYRQQRFLQIEEKVRIESEVGDYYKILPPKNTFVFLPPASVRPATAEQLAASKISRPKMVLAESPTQSVPTIVAPASLTALAHPTPTLTASSRPSPVLTTKSSARMAEPPPLSAPAEVDANVDNELQVVSTSFGATAIDMAPLPKLVDADTLPTVVKPTARAYRSEESTHTTTIVGSPSLMAAEMRLSAISKGPLDRQLIGQMLDVYQTLRQDSSLNRHDSHLVRARLAQLRRRHQLAETLQSITVFRQGLKGRPVDSSETFTRRQTPDYAAVGQLLTSIVYNGRNLPVLYRVVDPSSGRTLAYIRPGTKTQATNCLGKLVGVVGSARFNPALKARIVEVERVDLLEPVAELTTIHNALDSLVDRPVALDTGTADISLPVAGSL